MEESLLRALFWDSSAASFVELKGEAQVNSKIQLVSTRDIEVEQQMFDSLFLMSTGSRSANPAELLVGKQLPGLIEKLTEYFDCIIIDSAPLIPGNDTDNGKEPVGVVVANGLPKTRTRRSYGYSYYNEAGDADDEETLTQLGPDTASGSSDAMKKDKTLEV